MADSNESDDKQNSSDPGHAFGRLRNPGVGTTEFESHEDDAVDKFGERLRQNQAEQQPVDAETVEREDVEDDELENVVLDALDSRQPAGAPHPATNESEAEQTSGRPIDETDTGTGTVDGRTAQQAAQEAVERAEQADADDKAGQVCPSCESVSPPGMRFCVQCGEALRDGGSEPSSSSPALTRQQSSVPTLDRDKLDSQFPAGFELVTINDDGTDGQAIPVRSAKTILGRDGDTRFPTDEFLNPKHARLTIEGGKFYIEDLHSLNGTFLKLRGEVQLRPGDTFLMGRQVLRFEKIEQDFDSKKTSADGTRYMGSPAPGGDYKILQIGVGNIVQNIYCLPDSGVVLGREKGDIIFKDDKFMSGRHARIFTDDDPHLADLNSSNGTWIKLWEKTELKQNDYIFMGQQLFRVELPQ